VSSVGETVLTAWTWRWDLALLLGAAAALYVRGWCRLRARGRGSVPGWRLAAYLGGIGAAALAAFSAASALASVLLTAHMIQHQLLTMAAAPLLLLGNPLPVVLWALPAGPRQAAARWLAPGRPLRGALRLATQLPVAGVLYAVTLAGWHYPPAYQASLGSEWIHDFQHLSFFATSLLFWWPLIEPAPRLPRRLPTGVSQGLRIVYLLAAAAVNTLVAAIIALAERVLYPAYAAAPRLFGLTTLDDQGLAGGIMWSGGHMYLIAILWVVHRVLSDGERRTVLRQTPRKPA
jgi:cytochrome c oxidase assembly factor CtaG